MQSPGERLEEARKHKGLSIREVAEATKIRSDYLQKFESNSFSVDLPSLYVRSFLCTYARFLELDPDRFIAEYDSAQGDNKSRPAHSESREAYDRGQLGESSEKPAAGRPLIDQATLIKWSLIGSVAVITSTLIVALVNMLMSHKAKEPAATLTPDSSITQQAAHSNTVKVVTFTAIDRTRVKVVQESDGAVLLDNITLVPGESRSIWKTSTLLITIEDRTKLRMKVNESLIKIPTFQDSGNYGRFRLD